MAETTTLYKGTEQVTLTPEDAVNFQGGTTADPFGKLIQGGWTQQAINAGDISNVPTPDVPEQTTPQQVNDMAVNNMANIGGSVVDFNTNLLKQSQAPSPSQSTADSLVERYIKKQEATLGKGQATIEEREKLGVPQATQQLQQITQQIAQLQAGLDMGLAKEETRPVARQFITGRQSEMRRLAATEIGGLATVAQALQGNIALAKQTAQETIDLKYADAEQELKNLKELIDLNEGKLTREEQKRADALNIQLQARQESISERKEKENQISNILIQGVQLGIDNETIEKIKNAGSVYEAASYLGPVYLQKRYAEEEQQALENSLKMQQLAISRLNATKSGGTSGTIKGVLSGITQAVIDNPNLFNNYTATQKALITEELRSNGYDTSRLGAKPLSDGAIQTVTEFSGALKDLEYLRGVISTNIDKLGPITGLEALNPWSEKRKIQADIDRIKQTVGKALEGGVLRKEDEEKYKKILAQITDTPQTALYKIDSLVSSLQNKAEEYTALQMSTGRSMDLTAPLQIKSIGISTEDLRDKYKY
jgi:hypothetical protein